MHELAKANELLMRLKLGQYQELVYLLCDINDPEKTEKVSAVDTMFRQAFEFMNDGKKPNEYKDEEWFILYDLYQVLRKAMHDAENPQGKGLDSQEAFQTSKEPLAKCIKKR